MEKGSVLHSIPSEEDYADCRVGDLLQTKTLLVTMSFTPWRVKKRDAALDEVLEEVERWIPVGIALVSKFLALTRRKQTPTTILNAPNSAQIVSGFPTFRSVATFDKISNHRGFFSETTVN